MNRDEVLNVLRTHKPTLGECFGVVQLALFGSFAEMGSDVDIGPSVILASIKDLCHPVDLGGEFRRWSSGRRGAGLASVRH